jgi:hypothetical protein
MGYCIKAEFKGHSMEWSILDTRFPNSVFLFTLGGALLQVTPEPFGSKDFKKRVAGMVWAASKERRDHVLPRLKQGYYKFQEEAMPSPEYWSSFLGPTPEVTMNLPEEEKKKDMDNTLYAVKETGKMGFKVAVNRKGEYVLEMKDTGDYVAFAADLVEEVIPFTVDIKFNGSSSTVYSYFATEGQFVKGDMLIAENGNFATVIAIDTKSRAANKTFKGRKLVTEAI